MKTQLSIRFHNLDSLRAIMMLLGLALHSAITYGVIDYGKIWTIKDVTSSHLFYDYLVACIHSFRMPIFFVMSGFFSALLYYSKSAWVMLKHRVLRVGLPFIIFLFLLWPCVVFALAYTHRVMNGEPSGLMKAFSTLFVPTTYIPANTMHLWYLEYLMIFSIVGWCLGILLDKMVNLKVNIQKYFTICLKLAYMRPFIFAVFTFVMLWLIGSPWPDKIGHFIPNWDSLLLHLSFYLFGWFLFGSKEYLNDFVKGSWLLFIIGIALFSVKAFLYTSLNLFSLTVFNSIIVWCFIFGITGLFVQYLNKNSSKMRYLSEASYWIYLIHLPITAFAAGLLMNVGLPGFFKFLIGMIGTFVISLVTYKYLVRGTFIGRFLNGRIYK